MRKLEDVDLKKKTSEADDLYPTNNRQLDQGQMVCNMIGMINQLKFMIKRDQITCNIICVIELTDSTKI